MKAACQRALWLCQALMPCAADSPGLQRRPEAAGMSPYCPSTHIGCEGGVPQGEGTQIRKRPLKHQAWAQLQGSEGGLPPLLGSGWGQTRAARALSRPWRERPAESRQGSELRPWALPFCLSLPCRHLTPPDLSGKNEGPDDLLTF